jgi:hypothetical protein
MPVGVIGGLGLGFASERIDARARAMPCVREELLQHGLTLPAPQVEALAG